MKTNNPPTNSSNKIKESQIFENTFNKPSNKENDLQNLRDYMNNSKTHGNNFDETKNILAATKDKKLSLNVEDLLIQEDKLYKILDNIRIKVNFNFSAEEYLEFSKLSSLQSFENFFRKGPLKLKTSSWRQAAGKILPGCVQRRSIWPLCSRGSNGSSFPPGPPGSGTFFSRRKSIFPEASTGDRIYPCPHRFRRYA